MKIGIIGRSEWMYDTMEKVLDEGHEISFIITSKASPEFKYSSEDFKKFADKHNINFVYDPRITLSKLEKLVDKTKPEICLSVNYSGVISQDVIDIFPMGILNAHGGDLPRYRGNACQAWAIINGEKKIGLCIHKMIGGELDSGNIIARDFFNININSRIGQIYDWFDERIPTLFLEGVNNLNKDKSYILEKQSTESSDALRCYPRTPEDGLIDWNKSPEEIVRLVNASSEPYSGAFAYLNGKKVIIWRASIFDDDENWVGIPGQISQIKENDVVVLAKGGKISLQEIEIDGKREKPAFFISSIRTRLA